jgi:hypothetical protein
MSALTHAYTEGRVAHELEDKKWRPEDEAKILVIISVMARALQLEKGDR